MQSNLRISRLHTSAASWERKAKEKLKKAKKQRGATKCAPSPVETVRLESLFAQLDVEDNGHCSSLEWYSVKKMMKINFGFVVINATSGIACMPQVAD